MSECLPVFHTTFTTEERLRMVSNGRKIALQQNFHDPIYQAHFITFMWTIGANFYQKSGFKEIIKETDSSEAVKINKFHTEISEKQQSQAVDQTNDWYWFSEIKKP
jgi:GH24 family phage-related lysozyme (muramidase)